MGKISELVVDQKTITEIEIKRLPISLDQFHMLDAQIVVQKQNKAEDRLPRTVNRPYPTQYVSPWQMNNGEPVVIRPIRMEDEPLMVKFHATLSEQSVYYRYFAQLGLDQRIAHERLTRICLNDYDREIALVAEQKDSKTGQRSILGVGRLSKASGLNEGEFALLVSDRSQRQGLGTELLKRLIQVGCAENLRRITALIMADNHAMQHVSKKVGFKVEYDADDRDLIAEYRF